MTSAERKLKIEVYGNAYRELIAALKEFPKEMWKFRPASSDWTIHEIIVHIADSEANSFVRCRRLIAEPGSMVMGYNEMQWVRALHYLDQSTDDALELFRWLRANTFRLIQTIPESTWANTVEHSENGTMTMDDWLDVYTRHVAEHVAQMRRVYELWLKK